MKKPSFPLLFAGLFAMIMFSSCQSQGDVEIKEISSIKVTGIHHGVLSLQVGLLVRNDTKHRMVVRKLKAAVFYGETEGSRITVTEKIVIPAFSEKEYLVPVDVTLQRGGTLLKAFVESVVNGNRKKLHLRGVMKVRSGILFKRIPFDEKHRINGF